MKKLEKRLKALNQFLERLNENRFKAHGIEVSIGDCAAWLEIRFLKEKCNHLILTLKST